MKTHYYGTQNDQFLLTNLLFNKKSFFSNHFKLCKFMLDMLDKNCFLEAFQKCHSKQPVEKRKLFYVVKRIVSSRLSIQYV